MSLISAGNVANLIHKSGQQITYRRRSVIRDSLKPYITSGTVDSDAVIRAAVRNFRSTELSGLIDQGDREVRIAPSDLGFIPDAQDIILIDGLSYSIINIDERKFNDTPLLYIIQVRGAG